MSSLIGAEGMGLYQLIISVYVFFTAFASGGLTTAVTRQVADRISQDDQKGAKRALWFSVILTIFISAFMVVLVLVFSRKIAVFLIKDIRSLSAIKILTLGFPFMGVASCFKGYFLARRNAKTPSTALLIEQSVRMALVFLLCKGAASKSLEVACAAVLLADGISEGVSCIYLAFYTVLDTKKLSKKGKTARFTKIIKENLRISLPITLGKYLATFLRTAENLLMPLTLSKYTSSYKASLGQFGMIKGMVLPILFFPSSLLGSITTLLIPEVSNAKANNDARVIKKAVIKSIKITLYSSYIIAGIFLFNAQRLGVLIYKSESVGYLIKALAPLVPIMYLDSMADGLLKGLDRQNNTLFYGFIDSLLRISLILVLVPKFGMTAFLGIMFLSNMVTCFLNTRRLILDAEVKISVGDIFIKPFLCLIVALFIAQSLLITANGLANIVYVMLYSGISVTIYCFLMFVLGLIPKPGKK